MVLMMGILLIAYDLVMPQLTHQGYSINTMVSFAFQMLFGFLAVGIYNYLRLSQRRRNSLGRLKSLESNG